MSSAVFVIGLASRVAATDSGAQFCERYFSPLPVPSDREDLHEFTAEPLDVAVNALDDVGISSEILNHTRNALFVCAGNSNDPDFMEALCSADSFSVLALDFAPVLSSSTAQSIERAIESIRSGALDLAIVLTTDRQNSVALVLCSEEAAADCDYRVYCALELESGYPEQPNAKLAVDEFGLILSATNLASNLRSLGPSRAPSGSYFADFAIQSSNLFGTENRSRDLLELLSLMTACLAIYLRILPRVELGSSEKANQSQSLPPGVITYTQARPWIHPILPEEIAHNPRRAMLLADEYVLSVREVASDLEETKVRPALRQSSELFLFAGAAASDVLNSLQNLYLASELSLAELAYRHYMLQFKFEQSTQPASSLAGSTGVPTASHSQCESLSSTYRLAIVASSVDELKVVLREAIAHIRTNPEQPVTMGRKVTGYTYACVAQDLAERSANKIAFLFPGLGASYPNMLADLCFYFPEVRGVFDFVERLAVRTNDKVLPSRAIFPLVNEGSQVISQALLATIDSAVVTLLLAQWALFHILQKLGVRADAFLGCSTGEFAVLAMNSCFDIFKAAEPFYRLSTQVSRSVSKEELLRLKTIRVSAPFKGRLEGIVNALPARVYLGAEMSNTCSLLSGERTVMDELCVELKKADIDYLVLPVAIPYHTPLVAGKIDREDEEFLGLTVQTPDRESWSASLAETYPNDPAVIRKLALNLFEKPIQFRSTIEKMYAAGTRIFLEVAPKGGLIPYVSEILDEKPHRALACNLAERSGIDQLHVMLASLYCDGVDLDLDVLFERRKLQSIGLLSRADYSDNEQTQDESSNILLSYFQSLNSLHASVAEAQGRMMAAYLGAESAESSDSDTNASVAAHRISAHKRPFLTHANIESSANSAMALIPLSTTNYPFILDHAIGGNLSSQKAEERAYLLPLMVAIEIMAEVSSVLFEESVAVKLLDIRANKRIRVSELPLLLKVNAELISGNTADVMIADAAGEQILAQCKIVFESTYPDPPPAASFARNEVQASKFSPAKLYGTGSMFHGASMQAVRSIDSVFQKTIEGKLLASTYGDWFANPENADLGFVIDPLILDNLSQFVLYQMYEHQLNAAALLPFHIASIDIYDDLDLWRNTPLSAVVHLRSMSTRGTLAVMQLSSPDGRLLVHVEEISSRAIMLDPSVSKIVFEPESVFSAEWNCFGNNQGSVMTAIRTADFPDDETVLDWLTDYVLTPQEQNYWQKLGRNEKRRKQWLMGRIAVKDAARSYLQRKFQQSFRMLDLQLEAQGEGSIAISLVAHSSLPMPHVSISHCETLVCAIAEEKIAGIDVEELKSRDEGFEKLAFTSIEKGILDLMSDRREYICWSTAFWTAKEASAKAHLTGFMGNPKSFEAVAMNKDAGIVTVRAPQQGGALREYDCSVRFDFDHNVAIARVNGYKDC